MGANNLLSSIQTATKNPKRQTCPIKTQATESLQLRSELRFGALAFRITAWYDWLLAVLALSFGTYTYKCLDYYLSIAVKDELSIRAGQIGSTYAKTGQIPARQAPYAPGLNDGFISVHRSGGLAPGIFRESGHLQLRNFAFDDRRAKICRRSRCP
jgi:hypothetical protein